MNHGYRHRTRRSLASDRALGSNCCSRRFSSRRNTAQVKHPISVPFSLTLFVNQVHNFCSTGSCESSEQRPRIRQDRLIYLTSAHLDRPSMTVASKHRPERERERACLTCRKSKTKCVGAVPGEEGDQGRCDKCKRLNLKCEFVELKKVGRPRKVAPPEEDGDADMRLSSDHDWMDEWTEVNAVATYDRLYQSLLAPLSPGFEVIVSPSPEYWPESSGTTFDFDFLSRSQGSPLIESKELTVGNSIYDLPLLARQYHLFVHSFLPLLSPDETQLIAYLSAAPQELLLAIVTVIDPSLGLEFTIPANDYDTTIYHLQSSILATHAAFGRGDPVRARSIVKWTQKMLLRLRWNELDAGESVRLGDRSKEELDLIRRLWYETYSVDIMLSVLTGTRPYLVCCPLLFLRAGQ